MSTSFASRSSSASGLGERLRREDVQGARGGILRYRVDDRQVVAEGLAARRRVTTAVCFPALRRLERVGLVRVEGKDSAPAQRRGDAPSIHAGNSRSSRDAAECAPSG